MRFLIVFTFLSLIACTHRPEKIGKTTKREKETNAIPIRMDKNHLIASVLINDTLEADFVLDTGSPTALLFDSAFVVRKGLLKMDTNLRENPARWMSYVQGKDQLENAPIRFKLGSISDTSNYSQIINLHRIIGSKAQGIIGMEFIKKYIMEVDYEKHSMTFHKSLSSTKDIAFDTIKIYSRDKQEQSFWLKVTFDPGERLLPFTEECMLDLGTGSDFIYLPTRIVKKYNLLDMSGLIPIEPDDKIVTKETISGFSTRISSLAWGHLSVDTPKVILYTSPKGITASYALIGNYIFKRYKRVYFDFKGWGIYIPKATIR